MSESPRASRIHHELANPAEANTSHDARCERRLWISPVLAPHSTLTTMTQVPPHRPLSLLFLQSSITQCFDHNGNPAPCP